MIVGEWDRLTVGADGRRLDFDVLQHCYGAYLGLWDCICNGMHGMVIRVCILWALNGLQAGLSSLPAGSV